MNFKSANLENVLEEFILVKVLHQMMFYYTKIITRTVRSFHFIQKKEKYLKNIKTLKRIKRIKNIASLLKPAR
jgi:hypothetical protein